MDLTPEQKDTLVELINIAFGRAAASLSTLTGQRVILDVPRVVIRPIEELGEALGELTRGDVATVHQMFSGPVAGDALLLLQYDQAVSLCDLLLEERPALPKLDASDREVLTEVGNILLSACLGTFGNLLRVHISFSVPRLNLEELNEMLNTLVIDTQELRYALIIYTDFRLRREAVGGYLVIVLGVASLQRLVESAEGMGVQGHSL
jgi:chemotaxis protein CheC